MPDWLPPVIVQVFAAGAVYGALKAELRALRDRQDGQDERIDQAHARIDRMLERP